MSPKKRVVAKGAFYFFMVEVQERRQRLYGQCSLEEAKQHAGIEWKSLTEEEKHIYEDMAKQCKEKLKENLYAKFTSDGRPIALVLKEEEEKTKMKENMTRSIEKYISNIGSLEDIKHNKFYIVSFNILCEVCGEYPPLEVGLVEYTIQHGFIRAFHKFIDPGEIPLGYASSAKDHSEATHGIPITGFQEGDRNYSGLVKSILDFLRPSRDGCLSPLFCTEDHMTQVEGCLRWLDDRTGSVPDILVWDIMHLLLNLRAAAGIELSVIEAESILNSAIFDYEIKSLCSYHAEIDNKNCALGQCRRLGYKLSNALLSAYGVSQSIAYQHLPPRIDPAMSYQITQLNVKQAQKQRARPSPKPATSPMPQPGIPPRPSTFVPLTRSVYAEFEAERVVVPSAQAEVSAKQGLTYSVEYRTASEAVWAGGSNTRKVPSLTGDEFPSLTDSLKAMSVSTPKPKEACRSLNPSSLLRHMEPQSHSSSVPLSLGDREVTQEDMSRITGMGEQVPNRPSGVLPRIAAQFPVGPANSIDHSLGRGVHLRARRLPLPGELEGLPMPRRSNNQPGAFMEKIAADIPSRGLGRGSTF